MQKCVESVDFFDGGGPQNHNTTYTALHTSDNSTNSKEYGTRYGRRAGEMLKMDLWITPPPLRPILGT